MEENNKLIAEFMGMKYSDKRSFKNGEWTYSIKSLSKFRSSWDWLMSVVFKIKEMGIPCGPSCDFKIDLTGYTTVRLYDKVISVEMCEKTKGIETVYKAVVEFINFYNKNMKQ